MNDKTQIKRTFLEDCYVVSYPTRPEHENSRLDQFMMSYLPTFSREFIKKKIQAGEIIILGRTAKHRPNTKIKHGDRVEMSCYRSDVEDEYWNGKKIDFDPVRVVYEDDDLIVISKPAFMSTHPAGKHLFNCANVYLEKELGIPVYSVHRLDRETSGLLLMAKNSKTASSITPHFEKGEVKKCYLLCAHKNKKRTSFPFTAKERLEHDEQRLAMIPFAENEPIGKHALTDFDIVYEDPNYVMALAFPKTGRQHQIRVHAAFHGYPLVGDKIYHGGLDLFGRFKDQIASEQDHELMQIPRHALHALGILFPYKGEKKLLIDHIPRDLLRWAKNNIGSINEEIEEVLEEIIFKKVSDYYKDLK